MRIAVVNQTPHRLGGAETYLDAVVPLLHGRGHTLALCSHSGRVAGLPVLAGGALDAEFAIREDLNAFVGAVGQWRPDMIFLHGLDDPAAEQACRALAPTAYVAHTYHGTCISGLKCHQFPDPVPCHRTFGPGCLVYYYPRRCGGWSPRTLIRLYGVQQRRLRLVQSSDAVLTLSEHMRAECVRHGVDPSRVTVLPHWPPDETPPARAPRPAAPPWQLLLLGRLERVKGGALLLGALPDIARRLGVRVRLTVAGDGPDRARLERHARRAMQAERTVEIVFAGRVGPAERIDLLERTHLLVVPSVWPEPFGLVGLEAARAGVPAVAFAVGGIPEWLLEGISGELAGPRPETAALAEAVVRVLSSPSRYARLSAGAAAHTASLDRSAHLAVLDDVFGSIVRRPA